MLSVNIICYGACRCYSALEGKTWQNSILYVKDDNKSALYSTVVNVMNKVFGIVTSRSSGMCSLADNSSNVCTEFETFLSSLIYPQSQGERYVEAILSIKFRHIT
jgi:hypothetical protein